MLFIGIARDLCLGAYLQYRGAISDNSKVAVGVLLFGANVIMVTGPIVIIGLVAFRALPSSIVQRCLGEDAPHVSASAAATECDMDKIGEVISLEIWSYLFVQIILRVCMANIYCFKILCVIMS